MCATSQHASWGTASFVLCALVWLFGVAAAEAAPPAAASEVRSPSVDAERPEEGVPDAIELLGESVARGTLRRLDWHSSANQAGVQLGAPVLVVHGTKPGPVLCLSSAVHGDELNGIEIVRRIVYTTDPATLSGTLIGVPIVNLSGFQRGSRYLSDRRDLNRYFPGNPAGSLASRVAYSFFNAVVRHCDRLVDLHTGSFHRSNLPQLRANLANDDVLEMTHGFGRISVLHSTGGEGTLRRAAALAGIPAVTIEAGEPLRLQEEEVVEGVEAIESYMTHLGMISKIRVFGAPQPVYYESTWVRSNRSGILLSSVELGESVELGQRLGRVIDPVTNEQEELNAPFDGRVLGMALNQVVLPGFAAFRLGAETREDELHDAAAGQAELEEHDGGVDEPLPAQPILEVPEEPENHDP